MRVGGWRGGKDSLGEVRGGMKDGEGGETPGKDGGGHVVRRGRGA